MASKGTRPRRVSASEALIRERLRASAEAVRSASILARGIGRAARVIISAIRRGRAVFFCGNGGSAAEAAHFAGEFVGRFKRERKGFRAVALGMNPAAVTAIGNDYGFEMVFQRELAALGRRGDALVAMSTSGNSPNVLAAVHAAKKRGIATVGFSGAGGKLKELADVPLAVPSRDTPRIQEAHLAILHVIAEVVEEEICHDKNSSRL